MFDSSMSAAAIAQRVQELQAAAGIKAQLVSSLLLMCADSLPLFAVLGLPEHAAEDGTENKCPHVWSKQIEQTCSVIRHSCVVDAVSLQTILVAGH